MDKEKVKEMAKERGLDIAEESLEALCHLAVDVIKELSKGNILVSSLVGAMEGTVREQIDKIDLDKDGK